MTLILAILFMCIGVLAGLTAGLFGLGGGIVIVPALIFIFEWSHFPQSNISQLAVGTSLATMIFTSFSSFWTHNKFGFVDKTILKKMLPGLCIGLCLGAFFALFLLTHILKILFAIFLLLISVQMILNKNKKSVYQNKIHSPSLKAPLIWSCLFGMISSFLGIGAGSTVVPYLNFNKVQFNKAVGTASALTLIVAICGTFAFMIFGNYDPVARNHSNHFFIYWPAVFMIAPMSVLFAYLGAKLSHKTPASQLRKIFSVFLIIIAFCLFFKT